MKTVTCIQCERDIWFDEDWVREGEGFLCEDCAFYELIIEDDIAVF